ncbi:putative quinol monooxygenase [Methanobacterium ferruginis]|uniref:putative quinol monooxygenase n=1 Tax=Methanobacterium ferruginis TaxID=710191 RepID=UPI002573284D|nr:putative quinol monooxygenase [Methanobacterium ferruginis]BDZ67725.1 antibiotic biosynthesis monooxygenase [Methanobacterium ferruginis]
MIIVTANITAKPGERDELISKSQDVIESTRQEQGNISYELLASTEDENVLLMFEKWESKEALDAHMQTEHFKAFGTAIKDIIAKELDITLYSADKV